MKKLAISIFACVALLASNAVVAQDVNRAVEKTEKAASKADGKAREAGKEMKDQTPDGKKKEFKDGKPCHKPMQKGLKGKKPLPPKGKKGQTPPPPPEKGAEKK